MGEPMTVTQAAEDGDTRAMLVATRKRIAQAVDDEATPARDLAALTKRLSEVMAQIEAFDARAVEEQQEDAARAAEDEAFDASAI